MNDLNSGSLETLKKGNSLLTRVRPVFENAAEKSGVKLQLEIVEVLNNPTALAMLNKGDSRFNSDVKPRYGWLTVVPEMFYQEFNIPKSVQEEIDILDNSTGMKNDERQEGTHFKTLNILNPYAQSLGEEAGALRLKLYESKTPMSDQDEPKINPSNNQPVTSGGSLVYTTITVEYGDQVNNHHRLPNDPVSRVGRNATAVTGNNAAEAGIG